MGAADGDEERLSDAHRRGREHHCEWIDKPPGFDCEHDSWMGAKAEQQQQQAQVLVALGSKGVLAESAKTRVSLLAVLLCAVGAFAVYALHQWWAQSMASGENWHEQDKWEESRIRDALGGGEVVADGRARKAALEEDKMEEGEDLEQRELELREAATAQSKRRASCR